MTAWTAERERGAVVEHVARCRFCRALLAHSRRRRDREMLDAAERLAADHAFADEEHQAFARGAHGPQQHSNRAVRP
jgi:hypothetical protein